MLVRHKLIFYIIMGFVLTIVPSYAFSKGKIYGKSKTISKEYKKYENFIYNCLTFNNISHKQYRTWILPNGFSNVFIAVTFHF